jgi:HK97 family phage major capsid protein
MIYDNLLKSLKSHGYAGGDDINSVKAYISKHFNGAVVQGGETVDVQKAFDEWEVEKQYNELTGKSQKPSGRRGPRREDIIGALVANRDHDGLDLDDNDLTRKGWKRKHGAYTRDDAAKLDNAGFDDLAHFCADLTQGKVGGRWSTKMNSWIQRAERLAKKDLSTFQNESAGADGGFLLPDRMHNEVLASADETLPALALRRRFETAGPGIKFPVLADADRSSGEIAGFKLVRTGEGKTIAADKVTFQSRQYQATKAARLVEVSNELLNDSTAVGVGEVLNNAFGRAVGLLQAEDWISGKGAGEPVGILNSSSLYTQAAVGSQPADTIKATNIIDMWSRLPAASQRRAIWLAHPSTLPQLLTLFVIGKTDLGTALSAGGLIYMVSDTAGTPSTLLGAPVHFTEACKPVGDLGDIILCDPNEYIYFLVAGGVRIDTSPHYSFAEDAQTFRVTMRDSGGVWQSTTRRDLQNYETSPFVALAAR